MFKRAPERQLTRQFTFFASMLGFVVFNIVAPVTVVTTPVIMGIIWAGAGRRYVFYATVIWTVLLIPTLINTSGAMSGVFSGIFGGVGAVSGPYLAKEVIKGCASAPDICIVRADTVVTEVNSVMSSLMGFLSPQFNALYLVLSSVPTMMAMAFALKYPWSRRLKKIENRLKTAHAIRGA